VGRVATIFMTNASGVSSSMFTRRAQEILGPAIEAAVENAEDEEPTIADSSWEELQPYLGTYDESPWSQESGVIVWKGELAVVSLASNDPLGSMMKLKKTGEHTFRRVRDDDTLGEEIRFDIGPDGRADKMWQHGNFNPRVR